MEIPTTEEVGRVLRDGPADAGPDAEEVEGRRREAQDFLGGAEGGGATGIAADVGGAASGGGTAVEGVGAVDVVGTTTGFSADKGIFDGVSSADIESISLLSPTSFPSLVPAIDNEACDDAEEPVWVSVSVVSITLEDGTVEFVREAQAIPGASSAGSGCCERSTIGLMTF